MERRDFLKGAAVAGAAAAASTLAAPAIAQGKRELKMVMAWPKNSPGAGTSGQRIADRITMLSGGMLTVKVYGAGELVPAFQSFDAVSAGDADMYHAAEYYFQGKSKAYNFMTAVPFGMTGSETHAWIRYGGGQQLWDELSAGFNIKAFPSHTTGVQMGGWFRKEIHSIDDFQGLKMRMPGLGGEVLRALGATPLNLPVGEIYPSLQSGAIDATEWVGPWQDLAFGFYKIAKNYYYPGFHEPGTVASVGINKTLYDGLTKEQQQIVAIAVMAEAWEQSAEFNALNSSSLDTLVNKHGVILQRYPDDVLDKARAASADVIATMAATDDITKRVYDSYSAFQKQAMDYAAIGELGYMAARAAAS
ncbi:MAG: TRAP transporter substrate-binding protein [Alphaproteobacteria bacterium]|nr:TRAP transporter substrate-binding protein [Alphaproteobacteria bacterium]